MPTSINFDKKLGFINGTSIVLPSGSAPDFSTRSLSFDGTDEYISTQEVYSELDGQTKATFSCWIKPISIPNYKIIASVIRDATTSNHQFQIELTTANTLQFSMDSGSKYIRATSTPINLNVWTHVMYCIDTTQGVGSERGRVFINGVDSTSATSVSGTFSSAIGPLYIGEKQSGQYNPFYGFIDEFAIWSGVDLRDDVATIYNNGKPADLTSLNPTSWYRAGESSTFAYPQILMPEDANKDKVSKYSLAFDGLGYVDCGDSDEFSFSNGKVDSRFSISTWVYMNDATQFRIASKMLTNATAEYAFFTSAADQLNFVLYTNNTSNRISRYTSATLTSYEGQWIHLAATYDGSGSSTGLKIYLNGNRVDDTTSNVGVYSAMSNTNAPFTIGRAFQSNANGKIDEAAVFGFDLGQSDVQAIYNSGIPTDISSYSPLGYWKLGEEAKFTDNWLVPNSALSNFSKYSFNFDGLDDYVNCGNGASLQFSNTLSVSCWVKTSTSSKGILAIRVGSTPTQEAFSLTSSGEVRMNNGTRLTANTSILDNNYHHIVVTYDTSLATNNLKIYIDGILDNSVDRTVVIQGSGTNYLIIGEYRASNFFNGNIDEVAVWDSELSAGAVTAIYNGGKPKDLSAFSPVSWWRMGEEATYDGTLNQFTIPDQGSGGNNGTSSNTMLLETLVGDTPQYYGGGISDSMDIFDRVGDAPVFTNNFSLEFDGIDDYVTIANNINLQISDTLSISQWIKFTGTSQQYVTNFGNDYGTYVSNGKFAIVFRNTANTQKGLISTININDGQWHHILAIKTTTNLYLYVDGVLESNANGDVGRISTRSSAIGAIFNGSSLFNGNIDEVALWNTDQSSNVSSIYNNGVPNNLNDLSTPPLSWWRFEEGSGITAKDSGSGGNDGTHSTALGPLYDTDRILAPKANNTVSFNMEEADIVEDTP